MIDFAILQPLGIALGLGLLVGLQRERDTDRIAGIRTFPMITLLGTISGLLAQTYGGWMVASALLALVAVLYIGNMAELRREKAGSGMTTEVAALVMYCVGAMLSAGHTGPAIALGGVVAVLLFWKGPLHTFVRGIEEADLKAVFQLVLIGLVILPLLPNQTYGWYDVLNPYKVWLMVVLIAGISFSGYIAYRLFGVKSGAILGGLLGGLISSTATTISYARQNRSAESSTAMVAVIILLATVMMNVRILVEIGVVAPGFLSVAASRIGVIIGIMVLMSLALVSRMDHQSLTQPEQENPAQLKTALIFGVLYCLILFLVAAAKTHFGTGGLYTVAVLSGLTDMDAITLSTAELVKMERLEPDTGWRVILVASLSNLVFKWGAVVFLGSRRLAIVVSVLSAVTMAVGILTLALG